MKTQVRWAFSSDFDVATDIPKTIVMMAFGCDLWSDRTPALGRKRSMYSCAHHVGSSDQFAPLASRAPSALAAAFSPKR